MNVLGLIGFGQPLVLWGLLGCTIPILLNLFNRHRFQKVHWAAMRFLNLAVEKNQRKLKIENLILLLLRIFIIALFVLALSQPFLKSKGALASILSSKSNNIIVIDNSYSMNTYLGNKTYFDQAKEKVRQLIQKSEVGDRVALIVVNQNSYIKSEPQVMDKQGNAKKDILMMVNELEISDRSSNFSSMFSSLLHVIRKLKEAPALKKSQYVKNIYFVTDNQRIGWKNPLKKEDIAFLKKEHTVFHIIDIAKKQGNLGVTKFEILGNNVRVNLPFRFLCKVKNFGSKDIKKGYATVRIVNTKSETEGKIPKTSWTSTTVPFSIRGGEEKIIPLPKMLLKEKGIFKGEVLLKRNKVESQDDALLKDNLNPLVFEVKSPMKILVLDGEPGEPGEVAFLKLALNPTILEKRKIPWIFEPYVQTYFPSEDLKQYHAIILANFSGLTHSVASRLEKYVRNGGGLFIFLGGNFSAKLTVDRANLDNFKNQIPPYLAPFKDLVNQYGEVFEKKLQKGIRTFYPLIDIYNILLYKKGKGLLPGKISWADRKIFANLDPENYNHPIFADFIQDKDRITSPRFEKYVALFPNSKSRILATFTDEEKTPALLEKSFGKGKVILMNTSADRDWTNLPASPAYYILMKKIALYLAREQKDAKNFMMGDWISFPSEINMTPTLYSPLGEATSDPLEKDQDSVAIASEFVGHTGIYKMEWRSGSLVKKKKYFSLKLNPEEGDLDRFSKGEIKKYMDGLVTHVYGDNSNNIDSSKVSKNILSTNQLWIEFLKLAILFLLLEMWLSYWLGTQRR